MDVEVPWNVEVDEFEESEYVGRLVGLLRIEEHLAGSEIHGRKQIGGAVPLVVMGQSRTPPALHWQRRLGAIEGLDLGLLIETEDDSPLGRVQIEPDDIDEK